MTSRAQELLREALTLPIAERADVAAELLASLDAAETDHPAEVEAAWASEIERRARRVIAGESAGVAWEDVRAKIDLRRRLGAGHRAPPASRCSSAPSMLVAALRPLARPTGIDGALRAAHEQGLCVMAKTMRSRGTIACGQHEYSGHVQGWRLRAPRRRDRARILATTTRCSPTQNWTTFARRLSG